MTRPKLSKLGVKESIYRVEPGHIPEWILGSDVKVKYDKLTLAWNGVSSDERRQTLQQMIIYFTRIRMILEA